MKSKEERCPTCKQPVVLKHRRICWGCRQGIKIFHKWFFGEDGHIRHRDCTHPDRYTKEISK